MCCACIPPIGNIPVVYSQNGDTAHEKNVVFMYLMHELESSKLCAITLTMYT